MTVASPELLRKLKEEDIGKPVTHAARRAMWFLMSHKQYAPVFCGQLKPRMKFWTAALDESQLPLPRLPEVAIAGRSNSGKSTLVNYLCGRHSAHVKREPGSTRELVFWQIGKPSSLCIVDLPGYGFAYAPEETRLQWTEFALWYLRSRKNLVRVLLLVDSKHGLKPTDREMIAYLERHHVKWQVLMTKSDTVKSRDLARKFTILKEDLRPFHCMAADPLPISALKRQGMDALRQSLSNMRLNKDVLLNGIKTRIYDLMEMRRMQRTERARRQREKKAQEKRLAAAKAAAEQDYGVVEEEQPPAAAAGAEFGNLHDTLDDAWGAPRPRAAAGGEEQDDALPPPVSVPERHYSLDDRDARRVAGFMDALLPDLTRALNRSDFAGVDGAAPLFPDLPAPAATPTPEFGDFVQQATAWPGPLVQGAMGKDQTTAQGMAWKDLASDSESDEDDAVAGIVPKVMRFDPLPMHARGATGRRMGAPGAGPAHSAFPSAASPEAATAGDAGWAFPNLNKSEKELAAAERVKLRQGWSRPWTSKDTIYEFDDFASEKDRLSGMRPHAPPPPTAATRGQLMAEARRRYEREWAMELTNVDGAKGRSDELASALGLAASLKSAALAPSVPLSKKVPVSKKTSGARTTSPARPKPYIGINAGKGIPTSKRGKHKALGRPVSRFLGKKRTAEVNVQLRVFDGRQKRARNDGSNMTYGDAVEKWKNWVDVHKRKRIDRVLESESPSLEDVEARYQEHMEKLRRRKPQRTRGPMARGAQARERFAPSRKETPQ